ncbi:MAG: hypothetical protein U9P42_07410 [Candidatus Fermentibacteria bacterium]|nr:hypothetical protein [Candidatus Fermentibacteria bacterium]
MQTITQTAYPTLAAELKSMNRIGILVSGGCDSEVLLRAAAEVLGNANTVAFTAVTPFIAQYYIDIVKASAKELNIKLIQVLLDPMAITSIRANNAMRCYHCKKAIYSTIKTEALKKNITILADGTNLDDSHQHRPGMKAAEELKILHPFKTAGMTKADVRMLGGLLKMADPQRPADSCLATRIPEGTPITTELISLIARIEQPLRSQAKARLRARISNSCITLEYQTTDKELVEGYRKKLQAIAESAEFSILFLETDDRPRELYRHTGCTSLK